MIVEIRGCTGAGKSTVMRQLIAHFHMEFDGVAYTNKAMAILGRYDIPTGGLENSSYRVATMRDMVNKYAATHQIVFFESGYLSKGRGMVYQNLLANHKDRYTVIWVDASVEKCLEQVKIRRSKGRPVRQSEVYSIMRQTTIALAKIKLDGVPIYFVTPDSLLTRCVDFATSVTLGETT